MIRGAFGIEAQRERLSRERAELLRQLGENQKRREYLDAAEERRRNDTDEVRARRIRTYRTRKGLNDVRFLLAGNVHDLRAFEFIYRRWRRSRTGFAGVPIRMRELEAHLGLSERQTKRVIKRLDQERGLVVRLERPGDVTRFAVSLPEGEPYREYAEFEFMLNAERIAQASEMLDFVP